MMKRSSSIGSRISADTLGVEIPDSQDEDRESLRDWENKVVKSLANIENASKILKFDLENGGD